MTPKLGPLPDAALHTIAVSDVHAAVESDADPPMREKPLVDACPMAVPKTVTLAAPVAATLLRTAELTVGRSYESTPIVARVPTFDITVDAMRAPFRLEVPRDCFVVSAEDDVHRVARDAEPPKRTA